MKPKNWHRKLLLNHTYLYGLNAFHFVAGLTPEPLRSLMFRLVLKRMGKGVYVDARVYFKFPHRIEIGDYVSINRGCEFYPSHFGNSVIRIGSNVRIGPNVCFFGAGHNVDSPNFEDVGGDIIVGDDCWIGGNVTLLPGAIVGEGTVVAAGSVVSAEAPAFSVVGGVPAKVIRSRKLSA
jgi:maltose O-acetyltransferase